MPAELITPPVMEVAKAVSPEYRAAISKVRDTIASVPVLRDEEWSSLTKHVTELYILDRFGYLRSCSADSVVDGIIPLAGETEVTFNASDAGFLSTRGIQIKGRRPAGRGYGFTGDIKLSSPFRYLYIVWVDAAYHVKEDEVYRLEYDTVKQLLGDKVLARPKGKNNLKITRREAALFGAQLGPAVQPGSAPSLALPVPETNNDRGPAA